MHNSSPSPQLSQWAMFLHLSVFSGVILPGLGFIVPIIIWQYKREEFPELDAHAKIVMNWIISELIYFVAVVLLCFVLIGFILLPILIIISIVFPIIGGMKAGEGKLWKYPLSFPIL